MGLYEEKDNLQVKGDLEVKGKVQVPNLLGDTVLSEQTFGQAPAVGTSNKASREDHTHGTPKAGSVRASRLAALSIPDAVATTINLDGEVIDTAGYHDNAINPSRLTVPTGLGGKYLVHATVDFQANVLGIRGVQIWRTGVFQTVMYRNPTDNVESMVMCSWLVQLNDGDYVEMKAYHSGTGGALNLITGNSRTFLYMTRVGD